MKVQREKGAVLRLQFVSRHVLKDLHMILISHYLLEELPDKNTCKKAFDKACSLGFANEAQH